MKRKWRMGRVVLAVALVGFAALVLRNWPLGPLWRVQDLPPNTTLVGFDERRGVVVTASPEQETQTLRSYAVRTGAVVGTRSLRLPPSGSVTAWPLVLTPGGKAAALSVLGERGHLVSVIEGGPTSELRTRNGTPPGYPGAYGFSADGSCLATCVPEAEAGFDMLNVWDVTSETFLFQARLPHQKATSRGSGAVVHVLPPELIHMTADRRFVAAQLSDNSCVIYDVVKKKVVLRADVGGCPRFTADGQTLVILPAHYYERQALGPIVRYVREGDNWAPPKKADPWFSPGATLMNFVPDAFVTAVPEIVSHDPEWLKWLPDWVRKTAGLPWDRNQIRVYLWSLQTGNYVDQVIVPHTRNLDMYFKRSLLAFSWEGKLHVAVADGESLQLWESQPRRPLACWLTCGGLVLAAAWVAWPRRSGTSGTS